MTGIITSATFRALWERAAPQHVRDGKRFAVAFSGGADSLCVLFLFRQYLDSIGHPPNSLVSLTIDHGLQAASGRMTEQCRKLSTSLGIPNIALSIPWSRPPYPPRPKPGDAIEQVARNARYQLLFDAMQDQGCDTLVMGHHADDQVETILGRMVRRQGYTTSSFTGMRPCRRWGMGFGSKPETLGWAGAAGMAKWVVRPLLPVSKDRILQTCHENQLEFVQDETNFDPALTPRNAMRAALSGKDLSGTLPEEQTTAIAQIIEIATQKAVPGSTSIKLDHFDRAEALREWVAQMEAERSHMDHLVTELLGTYRVDSSPSTLILRTERMQAERNPPKAVQREVLLRVLRFVSPKPWGSTYAEAGRSTALLDRVATRLFSSSVEDDDLPNHVTGGGEVLFRRVLRLPSGLIKSFESRLNRSAAKHEAETCWIAMRAPLTSAALAGVMDITEVVRSALDGPSDGDGAGLNPLWDCRFVLHLEPWLLPAEVKEVIRRDMEVKITVEAVAPWSLPQVVMTAEGQKTPIGGYLRGRDFPRLSIPGRGWLVPRNSREISAL